MRHLYSISRRTHTTFAALLLTVGTAAAKDYVVNVLNSAGDPQVGMILRIQGKEYTSNEQGVIEFAYDGDHSTWLYLYFPSDKTYCVKSFSLEEADTQPVFRIDSPADILRYQQQGKTFLIEGMVKDMNDRPFEGASVSVQGTGRRTVTDEAGLFQIEGDYSHPIVVRALGMETRSVPIRRFLERPEDTYAVYLSPKNASTVYASAEVMPEFPGGMKAFRNYLDRHLEYPAKAKAAKKEGVVVIQFVVEPNGNITQATVARRLEASMDTAALRVIESMPDWLPARDNGRTIRCRYSLPVAFKLPKPKPAPAAVGPLPLLRPLGTDSLATDSLAASPLASDTLRTDSLGVGTLRRDSLGTDSLHAGAVGLPTDSLHRLLPDSLALRPDTPVHPTDTVRGQPQLQAEKPRKKGLFARIARFFRRLFGGKDNK